MALFEKDTSSTVQNYYDKWLGIATDGNVSYAAEYDSCFNRTRIRFTCKCGSMLEVKTEDMKDAVPYEAQEFVKLHRHSNIEEKRYCPTCYSEVLQQWNRYLCMLGCHPAGTGWDKSETLDAVPAAGIPGAVSYSFKYTAKSPPEMPSKLKPGQIVNVWGETPEYQYLGTPTQPALKKSAPALKKSTGRKFR